MGPTRKNESNNASEIPIELIFDELLAKFEFGSM